MANSAGSPACRDSIALAKTLTIKDAGGPDMTTRRRRSNKGRGRGGLGSRAGVPGQRPGPPGCRGGRQKKQQAARQLCLTEPPTDKIQAGSGGCSPWRKSAAWSARGSGVIVRSAQRNARRRTRRLILTVKRKCREVRLATEVRGWVRRLPSDYPDRARQTMSATNGIEARIRGGERDRDDLGFVADLSDEERDVGRDEDVS
jgi:hypothetical protein